MATFEVKVEIATRAASAWIFTCSVLAFVVGHTRAASWAKDGAWRLARWRVKGSRRWLRFSRELHEESIRG